MWKIVQGENRKENRTRSGRKWEAVNNAEMEGVVATIEEKWIDYTGWWRRQAFLTNCWGKKKIYRKVDSTHSVPSFFYFYPYLHLKLLCLLFFFLFCLLSSNQARTNCIFYLLSQFMARLNVLPYLQTHPRRLADWNTLVEREGTGCKGPSSTISFNEIRLNRPTD